MKRFFKWPAIVIGSLVLLLILLVGSFIAWLKWSGECEWKQAQKELHAKGEKLTFAELVSTKPVSDSENFYGDTLWKEVYMAAAAKTPKTEDPNFGLHVKSWAINSWEMPLSDDELVRFNAILPSSKYTASLKRCDAVMNLKTSLNSTSVKTKGEKARLLLELAKPADEVLKVIADLTKRPFSYLPLRYEGGANMALPQLTPILHLGKLLGAKATADLVLENTESSVTEINTLIKLSNVLNEPILITLLVREALLKIALETINYGVSIHAWSEDQLRSFQNLLMGQDLIYLHTMALSGERACIDEFSLLNISEIQGLKEKQSPIVTMAQFINQGRQKAFYDLWIQQFINLLHNQPLEGLNEKKLPALVTVKDAPTNLEQINYFMKALLVLLVQEPSRRGLLITTETQTLINQTLIACSLERYRLTHGSYPTSLDTLVPDFIAKLPNSPINGKPMNYRLLPDGTFLLWTPGWKLQTLDGKSGKFQGEGDIVWGEKIPLQSRENHAAKP